MTYVCGFALVNNGRHCIINDKCVVCNHREEVVAAKVKVERVTSVDQLLGEIDRAQKQQVHKSIDNI